jgi:hypothetical protein
MLPALVCLTTASAHNRALSASTPCGSARTTISSASSMPSERPKVLIDIGKGFLSFIEEGRCLLMNAAVRSAAK